MTVPPVIQQPTLNYSQLTERPRIGRAYLRRVIFWEFIYGLLILICFLTGPPYLDIFRHITKSLPPPIDFIIRFDDWVMYQFGWIVLLVFGTLIPLPVL